MTNINTPAPAGKQAREPSINDNLPTSNPPLKVVLAVLGCIAVAALILTFHASLGF